MDRALGIASLSLHRPEPLDLVRAAAEAGFAQTGLRLALPFGVMAPECTDAGMLAELKRELDQHDLEVLEVSNVELDAGFDPHAVRRVAEVAAELGATHLQVVDWDPERQRAVQHLGEVCDAAAAHGLDVAFEFMAYSESPDLGDAQALLRSVGRANTGLMFDVLHFVRSGGRPEDLHEALSPGEVSIVQLCDARAAAPTPEHLRWEALEDRLPPGKGELPLRLILGALSPLPALSVEAPTQALKQLPPAAKAAILFQDTQAFLNAALADGVITFAS